jgi:hypothetical protein
MTEEQEPIKKQHKGLFATVASGCVTLLALIIALPLVLSVATPASDKQDDQSANEAERGASKDTETPLVPDDPETLSDDNTATDTVTGEVADQGDKPGSGSQSRGGAHASDSNSGNTKDSSGDVPGGGLPGQIWHEGWMEQVPVYTTHTEPGHWEPTYAMRDICNNCGTDVTGNPVHFSNPLVTGCSSWRNENRQTGSTWVEPITTTYISSYNHIWHPGYWE